MRLPALRFLLGRIHLACLFLRSLPNPLQGRALFAFASPHESQKGDERILESRGGHPEQPVPRTLRESAAQSKDTPTLTHKPSRIGLVRGWRDVGRIRASLRAFKSPFPRGGEGLGVRGASRIFSFGLAAFALVFACRAGDLLTTIRDSRAGAPQVADRPARSAPAITATEVALIETPTEAASETPIGAAVETPTEGPTETLEPSPTELPTDTPEPLASDTPLPTGTPAPPTRVPPPTLTFTPEPPPSPTRCPEQYCVIKSDCIPGHDTRAIGHIYANGAPVDGIRVRVSFDYGGAPVTEDFISGHNPIDRFKLDPQYSGYYQVGILDGAPQDGNWWVFLVDKSGNNVISEGRWFKTANVTTDNSCNIGVTDFGG